MNHETAFRKAKEIADRILAPAARQNDKEARFSSEAVDALGRAGLLGLMLPTEFGGSGLGTAHLRGRHRGACRSRRIGRDGLSDAHLRHRDDRRGSARAPPSRTMLQGDRCRPTSVHARLQRSRLAQPLLGACLARAPQRRRRAAHGEEIVGDERRSRAKLCRLVARARRDRTRPIRPSTSSPAARLDCRSPAHGMVWGCAPTPPRR